MSQSVHESAKRVEMSANLRATLQRAGRYSAEQKHRFVTIEHILLALNEDPEAELMLNACSIDQSRLHNDAAGYLNLLQDRVGPHENAQPVLDTEAARIVNSAVIAAQKSRRDKVNGAIVLAAIIGDGKTPAANMLSSQGLTFQAAIKALQTAQGAVEPSHEGSVARPSSEPSSSDQAQLAAAANQDRAAASAQQIQASSLATTGLPATAAGSTTSRHSTASAEAATRATQVSAHTAGPQPTAPYTAGNAPASPESRPLHDGAARPPQSSDTLARFERRAPSPPPPGRLEQSRSDFPSQVSGSTQPEARQPSAPPPLPLSAAPMPHRTPAQQPEVRSQTQPQSGQPPQSFRQGLGGDPLRRPPPPEAMHGPQYAESYPAARPPANSDPSTGHSRQMPPPPPPYASAPPQYAPAGNAHFNAYAPADYIRDYPNSQPPQPPSEAQNLPAVVPGENVRPTRIIRAGQLLENIPRRMKVGAPQAVEVRIARSELQNIASDMSVEKDAQRHELVITKVMAVRMRAPDDGFFIEPVSPETQWMENHLGPLGDEFANWRWKITPKRAGRATLQLIVSARTIGGDGMAAETALPDQLFDIRISPNYSKTLLYYIGLVTAAVVGGLLVKFGGDIFRLVEVLIRSAANS